MRAIPSEGPRTTLFSALAMVLGGCSLALDTGQTQCSADADCADRGLPGACVDEVCTEIASPDTVATGAGGGATTSSSATSGAGGAGGGQDDKWSCLGNVDWPPPDTETFVTLTATFRGVGGSPPPPDLTFRFCAIEVPTCDDPLVDDTPVPEDGLISIEVRAGTLGYFEVTGGDLRPTLLFVSRPVDEGSSAGDAAVTLITETIYDLIVAEAGFTTDDARGTLLTITTDCNEEPAAGVRVETEDADEGSTRFYFVGLVPSPDETVTGPGGLAGFLNLPPGDGLAESLVDADDRSIGKVTFRIRPGWLSFVAIEPTPVD